MTFDSWDELEDILSGERDINWVDISRKMIATHGEMIKNTADLWRSLLWESESSLSMS